METTALQKMDEKGMLARIGMAKFPQELSLPEKKLLAEVARSYGFDPLMGEVTIYQGRPYVSIEGRYRKAQDTGLLDGVEARPATEDERKEWRIPKDDYFFRAEVRVKGCSHPFIGWGRVRSTETMPGQDGKTFKPIQNNPQRMAEKRAEAQALRKAFNIPLPSFESAGTPEDEADIIESTGKVVEQASERNPGPAAEQPSKDILTLGRLLDWCLSHGNSYDKTWFLKNQSYKECELIGNQTNLLNAMREICNLTGWDGV